MNVGEGTKILFPTHDTFPDQTEYIANPVKTA